MKTLHEQTAFDFAEPDRGPLWNDPVTRAVASPRPETVTVTEAANVLGISRTTAYEAVKDGSLPSIRLRRRIVIPREWLTHILAGRSWPIADPDDED